VTVVTTLNRAVGLNDAGLHTRRAARGMEQKMRLQFIGCGDAFGSGGRANTCFHVTGARTNFLFDCGASTLPAMKTQKIDRLAIDTILITHFHGDHFGGIPFFMLDAMYVAKRSAPLLIAGPPGLTEWYARAMAAAFPGDRKLPFALSLQEVEIGKRQTVGGLVVTPFHVIHDDKVGPCLAYRVEAEGKVVCYSGDTEWTDALIDAARGADLFVCECYLFDGPSPTHMNYATLREKLPAAGARRVVLTHMSESMLARRGDVQEETARDGTVVDF
jgi:ribonuclease BN (tRNA processing enzyme)